MNPINLFKPRKKIKGFITYDTIIASLILLVIVFEIMFVSSEMIKRKNSYIFKQTMLNRLVIVADNIVKHNCEYTGKTGDDICKTNSVNLVSPLKVSKLKNTFDFKNLYVGFDANYAENYPDQTCIYRVVLHNRNPDLLYVCGN